MQRCGALCNATNTQVVVMAFVRGDNKAEQSLTLHEWLTFHL